MDLALEKENVFPWIKKIRKKILKSFPHVDEKTLCLLFNKIHEELKFFDWKDDCRIEAFYETLSYFYLHFSWKVNWNEESYLQVSCVQLLFYMSYVGLILSKGNVESQWLDKILSALSSLTGNCDIIYDVLLLIRNCPSKYLSVYREILRFVLVGTNIRDPVSAECFIKLMLLCRRFKSLILVDERERKMNIYSLASKFKCPADTIHFLSSVNNDEGCSFTEEDIIQQFLNKNLNPNFIKNLFEILFKNKYDEKILDFSITMKRKSKKDSNVSVSENTHKMCINATNKLKLKIKRNAAKERKVNDKLLKKSKNKKRKQMLLKKKISKSGNTMQKVNNCVENLDCNFEMKSEEIVNSEKATFKKPKGKKRTLSISSDSVKDELANNFLLSLKNKKKKITNTVTCEMKNYTFKDSNSQTDYNHDASNPKQFVEIPLKDLIPLKREKQNSIINGEMEQICSTNSLFLKENGHVSEISLSKSKESDKSSKSSSDFNDISLVSRALYENGDNLGTFIDSWDINCLNSLRQNANDARNYHETVGIDTSQIKTLNDVHSKNIAQVVDEKFTSGVLHKVLSKNTDNALDSNTLQKYISGEIFDSDKFQINVAFFVNVKQPVQSEITHSQMNAGNCFKESNKCVDKESVSKTSGVIPVSNSVLAENNVSDYLDKSNPCTLRKPSAEKCDDDCDVLCSEENCCTPTAFLKQRTSSISESRICGVKHNFSPESLDLNVSSILSESSKQILFEKSRSIYTTSDSLVSLSSDDLSDFQESVNPKEIKRRCKRRKLSKKIMSNSSNDSSDEENTLTETKDLNDFSAAEADEVSAKHHMVAVNSNSKLFSGLPSPSTSSFENILENSSKFANSNIDDKWETLKKYVKVSPEICSSTDSSKRVCRSQGKNILSMTCNESDKLSTIKHNAPKSVNSLCLSFKAVDISSNKSSKENVSKCSDISRQKAKCNKKQNRKENLKRSLCNKKSRKRHNAKKTLSRKDISASNSNLNTELSISNNEMIKSLNSPAHNVAEISVNSSEKFPSKATILSQVVTKSLSKLSPNLLSLNNAESSDKCFDLNKEDNKYEILMKNKNNVLLNGNLSFSEYTVDSEKVKQKQHDIAIELISEASSDSCYDLKESNHIYEEHELNSESSDELNIPDHAAFKLTYDFPMKNQQENVAKAINSLELPFKQCSDNTKQMEEYETSQKNEDNCMNSLDDPANSSIEKNNTNSERNKFKQQLMFKFLQKPNQTSFINSKESVANSTEVTDIVNLTEFSHSFDSSRKTQSEISLQTPHEGIINSSESSLTFSEYSNECTNANSQDKLEQSKKPPLAISGCSIQIINLNYYKNAVLNKIQNVTELGTSLCHETSLNNKESGNYSDQNSNNFDSSLNNERYRYAKKNYGSKQKSKNKISPSNNDSYDRQPVSDKIIKEMSNNCIEDAIKNKEDAYPESNYDKNLSNFELPNTSKYLDSTLPPKTQDVVKINVSECALSAEINSGQSKLYKPSVDFTSKTTCQAKENLCSQLSVESEPLASCNYSEESNKPINSNELRENLHILSKPDDSMPDDMCLHDTTAKENSKSALHPSILSNEIYSSVSLENTPSPLKELNSNNKLCEIKETASNNTLKESSPNCSSNTSSPIKLSASQKGKRIVLESDSDTADKDKSSNAVSSFSSPTLKKSRIVSDSERLVHHPFSNDTSSNSGNSFHSITSKSNSISSSEEHCVDTSKSSLGDSNNKIDPKSFIIFSASEDDSDNIDCSPESEDDFIVSDNYTSEDQGDQELINNVSSTNSHPSPKKALHDSKGKRLKKLRKRIIISESENDTSDDESSVIKETVSSTNSKINKILSESHCNDSTANTKLTELGNSRKSNASNFKKGVSHENNSFKKSTKILTQNLNNESSETNKTSLECDNDQSSTSNKANNKNSSHIGVTNSRGGKKQPSNSSTSSPFPQNSYFLRSKKPNSNLKSKNTVRESGEDVSTNPSFSVNHVVGVDCMPEHSVNSSSKTYSTFPVQQSMRSGVINLQASPMSKFNCDTIIYQYPSKTKKVPSLHSPKTCSTPKRNLKSYKKSLNVLDADSDKSCFIEKQTDLEVNKKGHTLCEHQHTSTNNTKIFNKHGDSMNFSSELSSNSEIVSTSNNMQKRKANINSNKKGSFVKFTASKLNISEIQKHAQNFLPGSASNSLENVLPLSNVKHKNFAFSAQENLVSDSFEHVSPTLNNVINNSDLSEYIPPTQMQKKAHSELGNLDVSVQANKKTPEKYEHSLLSHIQKNVQNAFERCNKKSSHADTNNVNQPLPKHMNCNKTKGNLQNMLSAELTELSASQSLLGENTNDLILKNTQNPPDIISRDELPCDDLLFDNKKNSDNVVSELGKENLTQAFLIDSCDDRFLCSIMDKLENDYNSTSSTNLLKDSFIDNFTESSCEQNVFNNNVKLPQLCKDNNALLLKPKELDVNFHESIACKANHSLFNSLNTIPESHLLQSVQKPSCESTPSDKNSFVNTICNTSVSHANSPNLNTSGDKNFINANSNISVTKTNSLNLDPCIELIQNDELNNSGGCVSQSNSSAISLDEELSHMGSEMIPTPMLSQTQHCISATNQTQNVNICPEKTVNLLPKQSTVPKTNEKFLFLFDVEQKSYEVCVLPEASLLSILNKPTVTNSESQTDINDRDETILATNKSSDKTERTQSESVPEEFVTASGSRLPVASFSPAVNLCRKCDNVDTESNKYDVNSRRNRQKCIIRQSLRKRKSNVCRSDNCC